MDSTRHAFGRNWKHDLKMPNTVIVKFLCKDRWYFCTNYKILSIHILIIIPNRQKLGIHIDVISSVNLYIFMYSIHFT
jgi:hypothetical protein